VSRSTFRRTDSEGKLLIQYNTIQYWVSVMAQEHEIKVNKTVSLPIGLVNKVVDESFIMKKDFSSTLVVLVRWGLLKRAEDLDRENAIIKEMRRGEE